MNINNDNWTSSHFYSEPLRAFISLGAEPVETEAGLQEVEFQYLVTMTDKDYAELYQSAHKTLDEALKVLNEKYGHWDLQDAGPRFMEMAAQVVPLTRLLLVTSLFLLDMR